MCGIAGILNPGRRFEPVELEQIVGAMADTMVHRGPDDSGVWVDPSGLCALSHRRLSILDLTPAGRQPMLAEAGSGVLCFNGEIYNYMELRKDLEGEGWSFRSRSDTEVLLALLEGQDPSQIERLDGMFAFAHWDRRAACLLLARDPFGEKPLYLAHGKGWTAFASELRALRVVPGFEARVSREALGEYLLLQYVHAPHAIYENTEKLEPGRWLRLSARGEALRPTKGRHFVFAPRQPKRTGTRHLEASVEALRELLIRTVSRRLRSDVPLGVFLSGGIDSTLVAAIARRELGTEVRSFTIGFEDTPESEHEHARAVARELGLTHREKILVPRVLDLMPEIVAAMDEPIGDSSCLPTYLLSRFTRERVTVALSGDGGDELFGGYDRYRMTLAEASNRLMRIKYRLRHRRRWDPGEAYCGPRWVVFPPAEVTLLMGEEAGAQARERLAPWIGELDAHDRALLHRMRGLDARSYLPGAVLAKVDRMSMAFSLEVRAPFLGREVAAFAETLPAEHCYAGGRTKLALRALAARYVSEAHVKRRKMGFGLPGRAWSQGEMLARAERLLLSERSRVPAFLSRQGLQRYLETQRRPGAFSVYQLWTLLVLELWLRRQERIPVSEG